MLNKKHIYSNWMHNECTGKQIQFCILYFTDIFCPFLSLCTCGYTVHLLLSFSNSAVCFCLISHHRNRPCGLSFASVLIITDGGAQRKYEWVSAEPTETNQTLLDFIICPCLTLHILCCL